MTEPNADITTVFLLRHGQTVNTVDGNYRYNGHIDVLTTPEAEALMARRARQLAPFSVTHAYSSDLTRSSSGAAIIARELGIPHAASAMLREFGMGRWEGLTFNEVRRQYPEDVERKFADFINYRIPGSETIGEIQQRVFPALDDIVRRHRGEVIVIVAHGGVNMLILCRALGLPLENIFRLKQDFCCINRIDYHPDGCRVALMNAPCPQ
ncbi:MAG: histidine phosphatase family protein [Deltaproteobacteria bacterium]|nr:histidine phosphatase family protein [Candidatus Anaeroferrophillacea bacterium]